MSTVQSVQPTAHRRALSVVLLLLTYNDPFLCVYENTETNQIRLCAKRVRLRSNKGHVCHGFFFFAVEDKIIYANIIIIIIIVGYDRSIASSKPTSPQRAI